jgi:hypothetical protein
MKRAIPLGMQVYLGVRPATPAVTVKSAELAPVAERMGRLIAEHSYQFKVMSKLWDVKLLERQTVQARVADVAIWLHAWACTLSRLDSDLAAHAGNGAGDAEFQRDKAAAMHFFDLAELEIHNCFRGMYENADDTMLAAADVAIRHNDTLPAEDFVIPEKSPTPLRGKGRKPNQSGIKQFAGEAYTGQRSEWHEKHATPR